MLYQKLEAYAKSNYYPFHMPGHKRQIVRTFSPYEIDITEIEGFDNLHHAKGILKESQEQTAQLYGSKACFFLINGSTCGILASISAVMGRNEKILVARNCHKSVYHALFLRQLKAEYIYPVETRLGIQGQITKEQIEQALQKHADIKAVLITSPTYDGVVSDVEGIAEVVHRYEIPLIVDSAHGAHFGFSKGFPQNAVRLGADLVIESVHKTLPAFTQTALLHVCSERVSLDLIKRYLAIYQTSSPSYILMAGMDACMEFLKTDGKDYFEELEEHLEWFYKQVSSLKRLNVVRNFDFSKQEAFDFDKSKILIFYKDGQGNSQLSGATLQKKLLEEYGLQMEMACGTYTLALSSIMDTKDGFKRLAEALCAIDDELELNFGHYEAENTLFEESVYKVQKKRMEIFEAQEQKVRYFFIEEAVGKVSADYVYLYPPGIPIIVPGEEITQAFIEDIRLCMKKGLEVEGLSEDGRIAVVMGVK